MLGGDFTGQSNKNVLSAYKRLTDKRTKERQKARKAQALDDSRAMLEAYRNALNLIPADSALLAQYQNEQFNNEMLEEEYFKRGD